MNQESGSLNFYIQDSNGQPQLIKFLSAESNNNDNANSAIGNSLIKVSTIADVQENSLDNQESNSNPVKFSFSQVNEVNHQINQNYDFKNAFSNNDSTNRVPNRSLENISNLKRDRNERSGKGLRHFSMRVCEKVKQKGRTSYNEVADELVNEYAPATNGMTVNLQYDHKNIRRRVYDALNVLMAMNIIAKERKEIRWLGLPTNSMQECAQLEKDKQKRIESIKQKTQKLYDLMLRHIAYKNLVERNRTHERFQGKPVTNSTVQMPFVVVNTDKKTVVDCSISQDKMEWLFRFNDKFVLHDDFTVLQKLGMTMGMEEIGTCNEETFEKAKTLLPKILEQHLIHMATNMSVEEILNIDKMTENTSTAARIVDEDTIMFDNDTSNMFMISGASSPVHTYSDGDMSDSEAL